MAKPAIGKKAPDIDLAATGGERVRLKALRGKKIVLYFYPKDNTPGCTTEGQEFRDLHASFRRRGAVVLGVSRDSIKSHENFKSKYEFPFELISDPDEAACKAYDVIKEKNMYGKKILGIERSTFLIDEEGVLRQAWRKVKAKGHAAEVLEALRAL